MDIKRLNPLPPPATGPAETNGTGKVFAAKVEVPAAKPAAREPGAVLDELLDRAAERMGGLPDEARQALRTQLSEDPFFQSRLSRYLQRSEE